MEHPSREKRKIPEGSVSLRLPRIAAKGQVKVGLPTPSVHAKCTIGGFKIKTRRVSLTEISRVQVRAAPGKRGPTEAAPRQGRWKHLLRRPRFFESAVWGQPPAGPFAKSRLWFWDVTWRPVEPHTCGAAAGLVVLEQRCFRLTWRFGVHLRLVVSPSFQPFCFILSLLWLGYFRFQSFSAPL